MQNLVKKYLETGDFGTTKLTRPHVQETITKLLNEYEYHLKSEENDETKTQVQSGMLFSK